MPTFTFQDIFKSSFLERLDAVSLPDAAIALALAFCLGLFIFLVYKKCYAGVMYAPSFGVTLIALTLITTLLILAVTSNIVLSLGMVGALSIVRFRTAIKDSRDTVYIFWAIVIGICCGSGDYITAAVGSAFVFLVLLVLGRIRNDNRALLILRAARASEEQVEALIFQYYDRKAILRAKNTTEESTEYIYELNGKYLRDPAGERATGKTITEAVYEIGGVEYFNLVMQNDEISG